MKQLDLFSFDDGAQQQWAQGPRGILISASAGSGKTYKLVHHFLGILHKALAMPEGHQPTHVVDRILTATFTRAAAGEIVGRLLERLALAMTSPEKRRELCRELKCGNLSDDQCAKLLTAIATRLHRLRVCTLDSFLVRSAQAFSAELGLPESWRILDDPANEAACLEAIDQMLEEHADDEQRSERMLDLLLRLSPGKYPLAVRKRLSEHLNAVHSALEAGPAEAWEVIGPNPADLLGADQVRAFAENLLEVALPLIPRVKAGHPRQKWMSALEKLADLARTGQWEVLLSNCRIMQKTAEELPMFDGAEITPAMIELLTPIRRHAAARLLSDLLDRNRSTRDLLADFGRRYRLVKLRRSAFRFEDFTQMLLDAGVSEHLADFYYRLDGQIDHILLDEFQDTSIPQWKLLQPMVDELMSGEGGGGAQRSFFCVGDVKQTLYGWRNAEPRLLGELASRWPDLNQEKLLVSRRSCPVIIETVNRVFASLERNSAMYSSDPSRGYLDDAIADWRDWFSEHSTVIDKAPGFCRLRTCGGENAEQCKKSAIALAAQRVSQLHEARPEAKIAVLVRRRDFISPMLAALRRNNLSASGEGGSPLVDDMAVCTILSLLHLIDHPSDSAAQHHVGESPLGIAIGITPPAAPKADPELRRQQRNAMLRRLTELRAEILDRGLGAAINRWAGLCSSGCDARNFRRLRQLVTLANGYVDDGGGFKRFIDTVRSAKVEDSEASTLMVMTIHAAKGRQFDYVILLDLDCPYLRRDSDFLLDRPNLLDSACCITTRPSKAQKAIDDRLARLDSEYKCRKLVEELCTLYVAMTRAQFGMEMIVYPSDRENLPLSAAGILRGALAQGGPAEPETVLWRHEASIEPVGEGQQTIPKPALLALPVRVLPAAADSRLRPVISPSGLEGGGFINLAGMSLDQSFALDYGSLLHRWFEMIEWLDDSTPGDAALLDAAAELQMSRRQAESRIAGFRKACEAPALAALLSRATAQTRFAGKKLHVWRERAFAVPMALGDGSSGAIVSGQIDRLVIVRDSSGRPIAAEVIDYKTDNPENPAEAEAIADHYAPQVRTYRAAVSRMLDLPESAIVARLAFVGAGLIVDL